MFRFFTGMNLQKRATDTHVPYAQQLWKTTFSIEFDLILPLFSSITQGIVSKFESSPESTLEESHVFILNSAMSHILSQIEDYTEIGPFKNCQWDNSTKVHSTLN